MKKDDSIKYFGVCLFFLGAGIFLGAQFKPEDMIYFSLGAAGIGLFLTFLIKPVFHYLGKAFKEMSEDM